MIYGVTLWGALTLTLIGLALYRKYVARNEDDLVHLTDGEVPMIAQQKVMARRLEVLDRWGKTLTFLDVAFGLTLLGILVFQGLKERGFFR